MSNSIVYALLSSLEKQGYALTLDKLISDRRGAGVYRLVDHFNNRYALKFSTANMEENSVYNSSELIKHESLVLQDIEDIVGNLYISSGYLDDVIWLLSRWATGKRSYSIIRSMRKESSEIEYKKFFIGIAISFIDFVNKLHKRGYVHGDLQPDHVFVTDSFGIQVIDFGLCHKFEPRKFNYRGGIVHFNSPEVAMGMLKKAEYIPLLPISEVYSASAVLFFLYTGKPPVFYGTDDYRELELSDMLTAIVRNKIISFQDVNAVPFIELEEILQRNLMSNLSERYTSLEQVIEDLRQITF